MPSYEKNPRIDIAMYMHTAAWPLLSTKRSRSGLRRSVGSTCRPYSNSAVKMSAADRSPPMWTAPSYVPHRCSSFERSSNARSSSSSTVCGLSPAAGSSRPITCLLIDDTDVDEPAPRASSSTLACGRVRLPDVDDGDSNTNVIYK